ncbi:MAG: hypothetical protein SH817_08095 [Leptospira sp.]|nr:hypothetical protein [Leptospira sp.]
MNFKKFFNPYSNDELELEGIRKVFDMSTLAVRYYAFGGSIIYLYYFIDDLRSFHYINAILRALVIILIVASLFLSLSKNQSDFGRIGIQVLGVVICLLEIETQFHPSPLDPLDPNFPFNLFVWFAYPITMLFFMVFVIYKPFLENVLWIIPLLYYVWRSLVHTNFQFNIEMQNTISYSLIFYIIAVLSHLYAFRLRYETFLNEKKIKDQFVLQIKLEKELEEQKVTKQMLDDLHDHLGADLLDILLQSKQLIHRNPNLPIEEPQFLNIVSNIQNVYNNLRSEIFNKDNLLSEDTNFWDNIKLYLLNRYSSSSHSTEVTFYPEKSFESSILNFSLPSKKSLFAIIKEISSNDLKYGVGESSWFFRYEMNLFSIEFRSAKLVELLPKNDYGRGNKSILDRINSLGGIFTDISEENTFAILLTFENNQ